MVLPTAEHHSQGNRTPIQIEPADTSDRRVEGAPDGTKTEPESHPHLHAAVMAQGGSSKVSNLLLASWAKNTKLSYSSHLKKWAEFCQQKGIADIYSVTFEQGVEFLADLYQAGSKYGAIAAARSALSAILLRQKGISFGKHPLVSRAIKGVFKSRPSFPKSSMLITFDTNIILQYMDSLPPNESLMLELLSKKLCTLLCILSGQRAQTITALRKDFMHKCPRSGKITFAIPSVLKHTKPGKHQDPLEFFPYPHNLKLCVVNCLEVYESRVDLIRENSCEGQNLIISYWPPYKPVNPQTLARYVKSFLHMAGIELTFSAHSTRSASTSKANNQGLSMKDIAKAAGWSGESTFQKFYNKPVTKNFGKTILIPNITSISGEHDYAQK